MARQQTGRNKGGKCCLTCLIISVVILVLMVVGVIVGANFAFNKFVSPMIGGVSLKDAWSLIRGIYKADEDKIVTQPYSEADLIGEGGFYANLNDALLQKPYTEAECRDLYINEKGAESYAALTDKQKAEVVEAEYVTQKGTEQYNALSAEDKAKIKYYRITVDALLDAVDIKSLVAEGEVTEIAFAGEDDSSDSESGDMTETLNAVLSRLVFDFATIRNYYPYDSEDEASGNVTSDQKKAYNAGITTFTITGEQVAALINSIVTTVLSGDNGLLSNMNVDMLKNVDLATLVTIPQVVVKNTSENLASLTTEQINASTQLGVTVKLALQQAVDGVADSLLTQYNLPKFLKTFIGWLVPDNLFLTAMIYPLAEGKEASLVINNYDENQCKTLNTILNTLVGDKLSSMLGGADEESQAMAAEGDEVGATANAFLVSLNDKAAQLFGKLKQIVPLNFTQDGGKVALRLEHIQAVLNFAGLYDAENPDAATNVTPHMFLSALNGMANAYAVTDATYIEKLAINHNGVFCRNCYATSGTLTHVENACIREKSDTETALYRCSVCHDENGGYTATDLFLYNLESNYALDEGSLSESGFSITNLEALSSITDDINMENLNFVDYTAFATENAANDSIRVYLYDISLAHLLSEAIAGGLDGFNLGAAGDDESSEGEGSSASDLLQKLSFNRVNIKKDGEDVSRATYDYTVKEKQGDSEVSVAKTANNVTIKNYTFNVVAELKITELLNSFLGNGEESATAAASDYSAIISTLTDALPQLFTLQIVMSVREVYGADGALVVRQFAPADGSNGIEVNKFDLEYTQKLLDTLKLLVSKFADASTADMISADGILNLLSSTFDQVFTMLETTLNAEMHLTDGAVVLPNIYEVVSGYVYSMEKSKSDNPENVTKLSARETCQVFEGIYQSGIVTYDVTEAATGAYVLVGNEYVPYDAGNSAHAGLTRYTISVSGTAATGSVSLADTKNIIKAEEKDGQEFLSALSANYYLTTDLKASELFGGNLSSMLGADSINFRKTLDFSTGTAVDVSGYSAALMGAYYGGNYYYPATATVFYIVKEGGAYIADGNGGYRKTTGSETGTHDAFVPELYVKVTDGELHADYYTAASPAQIAAGTDLYIKRELRDGLYKDERATSSLSVNMTGAALASILNAGGILDSIAFAQAGEGDEASIISSLEVLTASITHDADYMYMNIELRAVLDGSSLGGGEDAVLDPSKFLPGYLYVTAQVILDGTAADYAENNGKATANTAGAYVKTSDGFVLYDSAAAAHQGLPRYDYVPRYTTEVIVNKMQSEANANLFHVITALTGSAFDTDTICGTVRDSISVAFSQISDYVPLVYDYTGNTLVLSNIFDVLNNLAFRAERDKNIAELEASVTPANEATVNAQIAAERARTYVGDAVENEALRFDLKEFGRQPEAVLDVQNGKGYIQDAEGAYVTLDAGVTFVDYDATDDAHTGLARYKKNDLNGLSVLDNIFAEGDSEEFIDNLNRYYYINGGTAGDKFITSADLLSGNIFGDGDGGLGADFILFNGTQSYTDSNGNVLTLKGVYNDDTAFSAEDFSVRMNDKALADLLYSGSDSDDTDDVTDHQIALGGMGAATVTQISIYEESAGGVTKTLMELCLKAALAMDGEVAALMPDYLFITVTVDLGKALSTIEDTEPTSPTYGQQIGALTEEDVTLKLNGLDEAETSAFFARLTKLTSAIGADAGDLNEDYIKSMIADTVSGNMSALSALPGIGYGEDEGDVGYISLPDIFTVLIDKCTISDLTFNPDGTVKTQNVGGAQAIVTAETTPENLCARLRAFGSLTSDSIGVTGENITSIALTDVADLANTDINATADFAATYNSFYTQADGDAFMLDFSRNMYLTKVFKADDLLGESSAVSSLGEDDLNFKGIYDYSTGTMTEISALTLASDYSFGGDYYYVSTEGGYYKDGTDIKLLADGYVNGDKYAKRQLFYGVYKDGREWSSLTTQLNNKALGALAYEFTGAGIEIGDVKCISCDGTVDVDNNGKCDVCGGAMKGMGTARIAQLLLSADALGNAYITGIFVYTSNDASNKAIPETLVLISRTRIQKDGADDLDYPTTVVINGMSRAQTMQFFQNLESIKTGLSMSLDFGLSTLEDTVSQQMSNIFSGLTGKLRGASYEDGGIKLPNLFEYLAGDSEFYYYEDANGDYVKDGSDYRLAVVSDGGATRYTRTVGMADYYTYYEDVGGEYVQKSVYTASESGLYVTLDEGASYVLYDSAAPEHAGLTRYGRKDVMTVGTSEDSALTHYSRATNPTALTPAQQSGAITCYEAAAASELRERLREFGAAPEVTKNEGNITAIAIDKTQDFTSQNTIDFALSYDDYYTADSSAQFLIDFSRNMYLSKVLTTSDLSGNLSLGEDDLNFKYYYDYSSGVMEKVVSLSGDTAVYERAEDGDYVKLNNNSYVIYNGSSSVHIAAANTNGRFDLNYYYVIPYTPSYVDVSNHLVYYYYEAPLGAFVADGLGGYVGYTGGSATRYDRKIYTAYGKTAENSFELINGEISYYYAKRDLFSGVYKDDREWNELSNVMSSKALASLAAQNNGAIAIGDLSCNGCTSPLDANGDRVCDNCSGAVKPATGYAEIAQLIISKTADNVYLTGIFLFSPTMDNFALPENLVLISRTTIEENGVESLDYPTTIIINGMTAEGTRMFFSNLSDIQKSMGLNGDMLSKDTLENTLSGQLKTIFGDLMDGIDGASYVDGGIKLPNLFEYLTAGDKEYYYENANGGYVKTLTGYELYNASNPTHALLPRYVKTEGMADSFVYIADATGDYVTLDGGLSYVLYDSANAAHSGANRYSRSIGTDYSFTYTLSDSGLYVTTDGGATYVKYDSTVHGGLPRYSKSIAEGTISGGAVYEKTQAEALREKLKGFGATPDTQSVTLTIKEDLDGEKQVEYYNSVALNSVEQDFFDATDNIAFMNTFNRNMYSANGHYITADTLFNGVVSISSAAFNFNDTASKDSYYPDANGGYVKRFTADDDGLYVIVGGKYVTYTNQLGQRYSESYDSYDSALDGGKQRYAKISAEFDGLYLDGRADEELTTLLSDRALAAIATEETDAISFAAGSANFVQISILKSGELCSCAGHAPCYHTYIRAVIRFVPDASASGASFLPDYLYIISYTDIDKETADPMFPDNTRIFVNDMNDMETGNFFANLSDIQTAMGVSSVSLTRSTMENTIGSKLVEVFKTNLTGSVEGMEFVDGGIKVPNMFEYLTTSDYYQLDPSGEYVKDGENYRLATAGDVGMDRYVKTMMQEETYYVDGTKTGETTDTTAATLRARLKEFGKVSDTADYNSGANWAQYLDAGGFITSESNEYYLNNRSVAGDDDSFYQSLVDYYFLYTKPSAATLTGGGNLFGTLNATTVNMTGATNGYYEKTDGDKITLDGGLTYVTYNAANTEHSDYIANGGKLYGYDSFRKDGSGTYYYAAATQRFSLTGSGDTYAICESTVTPGTPAASGLYYYDGAREGAKLSDKALAALINGSGTSLDVMNGASVMIDVNIVSLKLDVTATGFRIETTVKADFNSLDPSLQSVTALPDYVYLTTFTDGTWNGSAYACTTSIVINSFGSKTGNSDNLMYNLSQLGKFGFDFGSWFNMDSIKSNVNSAIGGNLTKMRTAMNMDLQFKTYDPDTDGSAKSVTENGQGYIGFNSFYDVMANTLTVTTEDVADPAESVQNMILALHTTDIAQFTVNGIAESPNASFIMTKIMTDKDFGYSVKNSYSGSTAATVIDCYILAGDETRAEYNAKRALFTASADPTIDLIYLTARIDLSGYSTGVGGLLPDALYAIFIVNDDTDQTVFTFNNMGADEKKALIKAMGEGGSEIENVGNDLKSTVDNVFSTIGGGESINYFSGIAQVGGVDKYPTYKDNCIGVIDCN